jgi:RNA polymerase sigma factor (sigma-70 family)
MTNTEIKQSIQRVLNGDIEAYGSLVEAFQLEARLFAARLGLRGHAVDDLTQEAFLQALESIDRFDTQGSFPAWLKGIIRNLYRRRLDRQAREQRGRKGYLARYLLNRSEPEKGTEDAQERAAALRECLKRISGKASRLVQLKFAEGKKAVEVSKILKMSVGSVTKALSRIRTALRECVATELRRAAHG